MQKTTAFCKMLLLKHSVKALNKVDIPFIMKLSACTILWIMITVQLLTASTVVGQKIEEKQITLELHGETLSNALKKIGELSGFRVGYSPNQVFKYNDINLEKGTRTVERTLRLILSSTDLDFKQQTSAILIFKKQSETTREINDQSISDTVKGKITNREGQSLEGVSVMVKGSSIGTSTNNLGEFVLNDINKKATLVISFIGFEQQEVKLNGKAEVFIWLSNASKELDSVTVFNTGFQTLPKERATGSFDLIDNKTFNRATGTNVLDRLLGITLGVQGSYQQYSVVSSDPSFRHLGLTIRGVSTLSDKVGTDPLIILDNFPYEGDISNINPNDIESVTVLKDAAAASIWGARAGNGVIVLTTKKGKFNNRMTVEFNSNVTITGKPDILNNPFYLDASGFIDIESYLFNQGYYNSNIINTTSWPVLSPVVDILAKERDGLISGADAKAQLDALRSNDVRRDMLRYLYRKSVNLQNAIGVSGGTDKLSYALSIGYDNNKSYQVGNGFNRTTINTTNTYKPIKNLEITAALNYSQSKLTQNGNIIPFRYPYNKLADANGNPLPIYGAYRTSYVDSVEQLGFQDWYYRPLQELQNADNTVSTHDLLLRVGAKYKIATGLNMEFQYANETQRSINRNYTNTKTYNVRALVNQFARYDPVSKTFTYPVPLAGILYLNNTEYRSNNYRAQVSYDKRTGSSDNLAAIAGAEIRQLKTTGYPSTFYGYDNELGTANNSLNFADPLPRNPSGFGRIPSVNGDIQGITFRSISYFINASYNFLGRYTLSLSGRKDGSNIFGVKNNDRVTPLWSAGAAWDISKEAFYHFNFLPFLKLRATYGYNGNIYNGTAYVTGRYSSTSLTNALTIGSITPPNPSLKWERVRNINIGIDFVSNKNILSGNIELYRKQGVDLIEDIALAASTGFGSFTGNAASTKTNGLELGLTSRNIDRQFKWSTTLLFNFVRDKITKYDVARTSTSIFSLGGVVGKPISAIYSYKWAGLDPANGDPQGYSGGKISNDYAGIINNYDPDSLVYNGPRTPTSFGFLRNDFSYKGFTLSVNIQFEFGGFFRRSSTSLNYLDIVSYGVTNYIYKDYTERWQKPGDEKNTNVPSVIYPSNGVRETFYQYSSGLVTKGDNIRLQDIRLAYDINKLFRRSAFKSLQAYSYLSNLGIIWRANKYGIDPNAYGGFGSNPNPLSMAFGINASF